MQNIEILKPVFALVFLTFSVLILIPIVRVKATIKGDAKRNDFKLGESESLPEYVRLPNRNYMNLLELPILFYVVCILLYLSKDYPSYSIHIAWLYVVLRLAHSIIHITKNIVMLRLAAFALSNFVLMALWIIAAFVYF